MPAQQRPSLCSPEGKAASRPPTSSKRAPSYPINPHGTDSRLSIPFLTDKRTQIIVLSPLSCLSKGPLGMPFTPRNEERTACRSRPTAGVHTPPRREAGLRDSCGSDGPAPTAGRSSRPASLPAAARAAPPRSLPVRTHPRFDWPGSLPRSHEVGRGHQGCCLLLRRQQERRTKAKNFQVPDARKKR